MGKYKKLGRNFVIITIGSFAGRLISFLLVPFYTYILSTSEYGEIDLITTTSNLVLPLISLSLYEAVTRFALENKKDENLTELLSLSLFVDLIGLTALSFVSVVFLKKTPIYNNIDLFLLYTLVMSVNLIINQFVRGKECMVDYAVAGVIHTAIFVSSNIIFLAVLKLGVRGYLWAYIIGYLSATIFLVLRCNIIKYIRIPKLKNNTVLQKMLIYSLPLIPNAISWWISNSSDKYILTAYRGVAENGVYAAAYKIPTILTIFTSLFYSAWQISSIEGFGTEETRRFYSDIRDKYFKLIVLASSAIIAIVRPVAGFMFQKEFEQAWVFTPALLLASGCSSLANFYGSVFSAANKTKTIFVSTVLAAITNIIFNFVLIPHYGAMGAAIATLTSYIVLLIIRFFSSRKYLVMDINWKQTIVSYVLLILEVLIITYDYNWLFIPGISVFVLLLIINRDVIVFILKSLSVFLKRGNR